MHSWLSILLLTATPIALPEGADTRPFICSNCPSWNADQPPFELAPGSWYVGSSGLAAVLVDTGDGLLLIDGGLPQSAKPIAERIAALGFEISQLRWIANSHAHFDHAGGIAALARWSGATVLASVAGAQALQLGAVPADDPQAGYGPMNGFPPVAKVRAVADGEPLILGQLTLTPIYTAGHTPGSTSWHWQSCAGEGECLDLVYADSLTAVSSPDYRYSDHPEYLEQFRRSIKRVAELPCDIVISAHPGFVDLHQRQQNDRLREADGCRRYAQSAEAALQRRLHKEAAEE